MPEVLAYLKALGTDLCPFRFPLGAVVVWADGEPDAQPYRVLQRRITESGVSEWIEYLLVSECFPGREAQWGYDPDCLPYDGETKPDLEAP